MTSVEDVADAAAGSMDLIVPLEGELMAAVNLVPQGERAWLLSLRLVYDGFPAGILRFDLNGYDADEARSIAASIRDNPFLMREIDEYLWGESD
ncbi:hypothetical protein [Haliea sp. E17]|uniref:hypothetical protein n=1 Tax=Haliea sp. E17 TaxID=3401576 RepID=UPI003AAE05CF